MARMWMVRGEGGSLYDAFRERGVAAVGWNRLAAHAKPGVGRKLARKVQWLVQELPRDSVRTNAKDKWISLFFYH